MENNTNNLNTLRQKLKETGHFLMDILYNAAVIIILVILIRSFLVSPFRVVGYSMADTLEDKEFILIDKFSYLVGDVQRGDPIVFLPPPMYTDNPKFEVTVKTDSKGKGELQLDNLKGQSQSNYCKNTFFKSFWFCVSKPLEKDYVYLAPEVTSSEDQAVETKWDQLKRLEISEEDEKKGKVTFEGLPDSSYRIRLFDSRGPEYFVKRVIGIPGDTVKVENGRVYLKIAGDKDFREIDEPYLNEENYHQTYLSQHEDQNEFVVPEGHYFVMGDNRNHSNDSRSWLEPITQEPFPFVSKENISGKVFVVLWPLKDIRHIKAAEY